MAKNKVELTGVDTSKLKTIKTSEMNELFVELRNGSKLAKERLVKGNLKLVLSILQKYQNRCDNLDDLFQIGTIGLIKAIDNFDLSFGVKFSTYAVFMIEGDWKTLSPEEKKIRLYLEQKRTLDLFLERHAISKDQYEKSLGDLTEKMGMSDQRLTDDERIDIVAKQILEKYRPAFEELAK